MTYSNGLPVNSISTDLEGNRSYETFGSSSGHISEPNPVTIRGEDVGTNTHVVPATFANGIRLPNGPGPLPTPQPGRTKGDGINPVSILNAASPGYVSAYNPLDGFAVTTTGSYSNAQGLGTDYTNAYNYDVSGRMTSTDLQQCTQDNSGSYSPSESMTTYTYDAEDHMLWQSSGSSSVPSTYTCNFGPPFGNNTSYAVNWGTNGHPISLTFKSDNTPNHSVGTWQEYFHWDGDTLLFTSGTPSGPPDNIKVGSIAEIRPSDGAIQVFDRDAAGEILDNHRTVGSGWTDQYGLSNPAPSFGAISEPRPDNLTGFGMIAIQGARGVDGGLTQWTTPDAYAGSIHDPASQKPYMYERNNSYAYSDPSGYCAQRIGGPSEDCKPEAKPTMSPKEASELLKKFNLSPGMDGRDFLPTLLTLLGFIAPETRAVDIFDAAGMLTAQAIRGSKMIIPAAKLKNAALPAGVAKYTTQTFVENGQRWQAHFYMDPTTRKVFYGLDYKVKPVGKTFPW